MAGLCLQPIQLCTGLDGFLVCMVDEREMRAGKLHVRVCGRGGRGRGVGGKVGYQRIVDGVALRVKRTRGGGPMQARGDV